MVDLLRATLVERCCEIFINLKKLIRQPIAKACMDAFLEFNSVVEGCYGYDLAEDYKDRIKRFHQCYIKTRLSITPKIHAVVYHNRFLLVQRQRARRME